MFWNFVCWVLTGLASKFYPALEKLSPEWRPRVALAKQHYSQHISVNNFCCKDKQSDTTAAGKGRQCGQPLHYPCCPLSINPVRETGGFYHAKQFFCQWSGINTTAMKCRVFSFRSCRQLLTRRSQLSGIPFLPALLSPAPGTGCSVE